MWKSNIFALEIIENVIEEKRWGMVYAESGISVYLCPILNNNRRLINDLVMCFKIIHGLVDIDLNDFFQYI